MNRSSFQKLSNIRVKEAQVLLDSGNFPGAYYLIGYAIECALKACIAKQVKLYDFPDKKLANAAFTHDLEKLIRVAGLATEFEKDREINPDLEINWVIVKDWSESTRYEVDITEAQAKNLFLACTTSKNGILPWVRKRW